MSEQELIQHRLRAVASRLQTMTALGLVSRVALWASPVLLAALAIYKIVPLPFAILEGVFLLAALAILAALAKGFLKRVTPAAAAQFADRKFGLKERLGSAMEIAPEASRSPLHDLLLRDAARHAQSLDPKEVLPLRLPRAARWALLCLVGTVGLAFIPAHRSAEFREQQRAKHEVRKQGENLVSLVKRIEQNTRPNALADAKNELKSINELGQEFRKVTVTKADALRDINTVADKIRKKQDELGENKSLRTLERRAAASGSDPTAQQREQLQQKINDLQKKAGSNPPTPERIDKMKSDLKQALDKVRSAPNPETAEGRAAKEALEKSIEAAMEQARNYGTVGDSLEKALEGLKSADVDMVAKNITDAVKDLDQMKEQSAALQKAQQQAKQAGKDLAEQLSKGQAQAAKETLEKFIQQLQQSNLPDTQKQQIASELTKALDPAKDYGKVAEHLQNAVGQMAKNDRTGAANSMQAAAEELQKLLDQEGEGQQLAEMMDALKMSQSRIAGEDGMDGDGRSGVSTSGVPRGHGNRGFGDWPDENNTQPPGYSDTWDNEGLTRDDKDSRGVTDRGTPKIADNVTPTRIHGKMQNAGPMPGITLKGVSIKGQSNVEMEQSAAAAKQEAEDALNKEQIPKSYQGQVKDYFDSMK